MAIGEAGERVEEAPREPGLGLGVVVREFRCTGCGYGIVVNREPPPCPMCGAERWLSVALRGFR
jgi:rubrerythrin